MLWDAMCDVHACRNDHTCDKFLTRVIVKIWCSSMYQVLDLDSTAFVQQRVAYLSAARDLERRVAAVILQASADCATVPMVFKLLDVFEGLVDREVVAAEVHRTHSEAVASFAADTQAVSAAFAAGREAPPLPKHAAPVSGTLSWLRSLKDRLIGMLANVDHSVASHQNRNLFGCCCMHALVNLQWSTPSGLSRADGAHGCSAPPHGKAPRYAGSVDRLQAAPAGHRGT